MESDSPKEHKAARCIFISVGQTLPQAPFPQSYPRGEKQEEKVVSGKDTRRDNAGLCNEQFGSVGCRGTKADGGTRPAPLLSIHVRGMQTCVCLLSTRAQPHQLDSWAWSWLQHLLTGNLGQHSTPGVHEGIRGEGTGVSICDVRRGSGRR